MSADRERVPESSIDELDLCLRAALDGHENGGRLRALVPQDADALLDVCRLLRGEPQDARLPLRPGARLGAFELARRLGRGGQGEVWLAVDRETGGEVAIKVLRADGRTGTVPRRLRREAGVAAVVRHPGVCLARAAAEADGIPFLVMPFVAGATLAEHLEAARRGDPSPAVSVPLGPGDSGSVAGCVQLIEQISEALHCVHAAGFVHRDVKPANVMIDREGRPVLLDFGLVRGPAGSTSSLTGSVDVVGSPCYMSPEQAAGRMDAVDARSDVYSLAVLLYECLTLQRPFEAPDLPALYRRIAASAAPDVRRGNPFVSRALALVLAKALEKEPSRRYSGMADFAADLRAARLGQRVRARAPSRAGRALRWARREPIMASLVLVVLLLVPALAAVATNHALAASHLELGRDTARQRAIASLTTRLMALHLRSSQEVEAVAEQILALDPRNLSALQVVIAGAGRREAALAEIAGRARGDRSRPLWRRLEAVVRGEMQELPRAGDAEDLTVGEVHWLRARTLQWRSFAGDVLATRQCAAEFERAVLAWAGPPPAMLLFHWTLEAGRNRDRAAMDRARATTRSLFERDPSWPAIDVEPEYFLRPDAAVPGLRLRWQQAPDDVILLNALGQALCRSSATRAEGLELLRRARRLVPHDPHRWFVLGRWLMSAEGTLPEALAVLEECVRMQPWHGPAATRLGEALIAAGRTTEGTAWLRRAIGLEDPAGVSHASLGRWLLEGGRHGDAVEPLSRAVGLAPGQPRWRSWLAAAYAGLGRRDEALEHAQVALELEPTLASHQDLVVGLLEGLQREDEIPWVVRARRDALERLVAVREDDATAWHQLALLLLGDGGGVRPGDVDRARVAAQRAADAGNRGCPDVMATLAWASSLAGDPEAAVVAQEAAVALLWAAGCGDDERGREACRRLEHYRRDLAGKPPGAARSGG